MRNQNVDKNLDQILMQVEYIYFDPRITDKYLHIQALYQSHFGTIPSVGAICKNLQKHSMANHNCNYPQRATTGEFIYKHKSGKLYRMIQVAQGRWEPEHIVIAKACMGWYPGCVVHHRKSWDTLNNDPSNLQIMSRAEHSRLHQKERLANPEYKANLSRKMKASWAKRKLAKRIAEINSNAA